MLSVREPARMHLCRFTPKDNHHRLVLKGYSIKDGSGESLPTQVSVRSSLTGFYRQHIVEQQHPSPRPSAQATRCVERPFKRPRAAHIFGYLFKDVAKRRGMWHPRSYRESQSVCLTGTMVGILTANDHLDLIGLNRLQGSQLVASRRVANTSFTFDLYRRINGFQYPIGQAQLCAP